MVFGIISATVVGQIFAAAFCRDMDGEEESRLDPISRVDSIVTVKRLLSSTKIPKVKLFVKRNPRRYLC